MQACPEELYNGLNNGQGEHRNLQCATGLPSIMQPVATLAAGYFASNIRTFECVAESDCWVVSGRRLAPLAEELQSILIPFSSVGPRAALGFSFA